MVGFQSPKHMKFIFLFLFIFLTHTQSSYFKNFYLSASYDRILVTSRARYGYFYFGIAEKNSTTFDNGLALLLVNTPGGGIDFTRFQGGNPTNLSKTIIPLGDEILDVIDWSGFPIGRFLDDQTFIIELNYTKFSQKFPLPLKIFLGINLNSQPKSSLDFVPKFDESEWVIIKNFSLGLELISHPNIRIETLHPSIFAITLFYQIVLCIIIIAFSQFQPLKSRGVYPIFVVIIFTIDLACEVLIFIPFNSGSFYIFLKYFVKRPLLQTVVFLYSLYFIRFLLLVYLNKRKEKVFFEEKSPTNIQFKFKLLKYLGTFYIAIPIYIIFFIFFEILFVLAYVVEIYTIQFVETFGVILIICNIFFTFIIMVVDIILNFNSFKTCKVYTQDTLFFRFEFYIFGSINSILSIIGFIFFIAFFNTNLGFMMYLLFLPAFHHVLILTNVIFPLVITIYKLIIHQIYKSKISETQLDIILKNEVSREYLANFAKTEFSLENILCYNDMKKYQEEKNIELRSKLASDIYIRYFNGSNSELEVNVSASYCKLLDSDIQANNFSDNLFLELEKQVKVNLSDTYHRFIFSESYKQLVKVQTIFKEIE